MVRNPVTEKIKRIGVALANGKSLALLIEQDVEGNVQCVRIGFCLAGRCRFGSHRGVGVAVEHLLCRGAVLVEQQEFRVREVVGDYGRGSGAAACCKRHLRTVEIFNRKARGQLAIGQDRRAGESVGLGEIDRQVALRGDRQAADDGIELPGDERRNDAVKGGRDELHVHAHVFGQLAANIDFKPDQLAVPVTHRPGLE